jgi:hypothetical protein
MFYELVRERDTYDMLYDMAKQHTRGPDPKPAANLVRDLINIRSIVNHFTPRIYKFSTDHSIAVLTPAQVLTVVRDNYDTLNLKLMDNLDLFTPYEELPGKPSAFLAEVIPEVIEASRDDLEVVVERIVVKG